MTQSAIFEERFETLHKASSGGMGTVFRTRDRQTGAEVALKILRGENALDIERFTREATILADLRHPAIVRYVAHGITRSGEHYLAMEWLDGEDLGARLARRGLSMRESLVLLRHTAVALAFAHQKGLVHRDLKPSNLFLVRGDVEQVKIVDFGIARLGIETARVTRTGVLLGTPGYMAPEQIQGPPSHDPRADVFALGCVLFECLTGHPAFEGQSAMSVLAKILLQDVPRARAVRPAVPEPLDELVARMMARDPEERLPDAAAVVDAIDRLGDLDALPGGVPAIDPERLGGLPPRTSSLTLSEQRLVSVVLAGDADHELGGPPPDVGRRNPAAAPFVPAPRPALGELRETIEPHGGTLHALAGGSFLVTLWGAGSAIDRAAQAARCALALKARFPSLPVCVVTGRGLVSARVVEGAMIERGVVTLRAAGLSAVYLDDVTAGMLRAGFRIDRDAASLPSSSPGPDGTPGPRTHLLRGERAPAESVPLLLGQPTPCVGRARELSILDGVFSGCVSEPVASAVLVVGAAGSGKSRLRRELLELLQRRGDRVEILTGAGDALGAGSPLRIIADAINRAAGVRGGEPLEARRLKLRARIARHLDPSAVPRVVAFLGELTGTPFPENGNAALRAARDSPRIMSDSVRAAWEDWLAAECAAQPVVLVLEDMHFGDAATVSLVDHTLRNLRELPLMVLVLARPEVHERFPSLWSEREVQLVRLGPLARKASEQIVRAGLGPTAAPDLVARLVDRAQGNPFYLEELVRAAHAGRADVLPDSVLGTVEARLDAEGAPAKRVLRAASIFGDRFFHGGLLALLGGEREDYDVSACLSMLAQRELVAPAPGAGPGGDGLYVFCHGLVRDAAYATLTDDDRMLGHQLAGSWLEENKLADAVTLAEHFARAKNAERSAYWYRHAAEDALEANDLGAAVARAEHGIACGAAGEELGLLRLCLAEAAVWRGDLPAAETNGLAAAALLSPGSTPWFRALTHAVTAAGKQGRFEQVEAQAERAAGAPALGARSAQLACLVECASHLLFGGRYAAFEALLARLRRAVPDPAVLDAPVAAQIRQLYAFRASYGGDPGAALESFEAALASLETAGDRRNACVVRSNLGFIFAELGDFESAEDALRGAIEGAERMGLHDVAIAAMQNLGHTLAYLRRLDEARLLEQRAVDAFQRLGDPRMEGVARTYLAKIGLFAAAPAQAERDARAAAELLRVAPPLRAAALAVVARSLLEQDKADEALPVAREAHAILEELGEIEEGEAMVRVVYAEALRATGARRDFEQAARAARDRLLDRAAKISDAAWRERFLTTVPDNARTLVLWGVAARAAANGG